MDIFRTEEKFNLLDSDNDGDVSRREFLEWHLKDHEERKEVIINLQPVTDEVAQKMMHKSLSRQEKVIEKVFDANDENDDSALSLEEYLGGQRLAEIRSKIWDATLAMLDGDGDEIISQNEFVSAMKLRLKSRIAQFDKLGSETKRREAASLMVQRLVREYNRIDSNEDGRITRTELETEQKWLEEVGYNASVSRSFEERLDSNSATQQD